MFDKILKQVVSVLKDFKTQLTTGWTKTQLVTLAVMVAAQIGGYILYPSTPMALAMSLLGILTVVLIRAAKSLNYVVGFISSVYFMVMAAKTGIFGDMAVQIGYIYFDIVGLVAWQRAGKNGTVQKAVDFSRSQKMKVTAAGVALVIASPFVLSLLGDPRPFIDGLMFTVGMLAMYSMKKQYKNTFVFWIAANILQILVWWLTADHTGVGITIAMMYVLYLINSLGGLIDWNKKEVREVI